MFILKIILAETMLRVHKFSTRYLLFLMKTGMFFCVFMLHAQIPNQNEEIKLQIKELLFQENVTAINKLLNETSTLIPEYKLEILTKNLKIAQKNNIPKELAETYTALGIFWFEQGNRVKAYDYYSKSESISRTINDKNLIGVSLLHKGNVSPDFDSKITAYQEAIKVLKKVNDSLNLAKVYLNLGDAYANYYWSQNEKNSLNLVDNQKINFYQESTFRYYSLADSLNTSIGDGQINGVIRIHYAEWFKKEKKFDEAKKEFKEAEIILKQANYPKGRTYCILHLASIEIKQGNFQEALSYLAQAEILSKKYDYKNYLQGVYDEYVKVYDSIGDFQQALYYNRLYTSATVDLLTINSQDKIHALNLERSLSENELQLSEYEAKSKLNRILIIAILVIALAIGGISYLIIKNKKRKIENIEKNNIITEIKLKNQLLEDELLKEKVKFSQEHLMSFANQVTKIENFLDNIKTKLKKVPGTREEINDLKISFSELLNGQSQLKKINSLSSELNQDFFFYIKQNYPGISKGDEQLLAYIILDIGSKEISRILNISEKSIYIKRYRLRKKLKLENEETFEGFYQKIISSLN